MPVSVCVITRTPWPCSQNTSTCGSALMMASAVSRFLRSSAISWALPLPGPGRGAHDAVDREHGKRGGAHRQRDEQHGSRCAREGNGPIVDDGDDERRHDKRAQQQEQGHLPAQPALIAFSACQPHRCRSIGPTRKRAYARQEASSARTVVNESLTIMGSLAALAIAPRAQSPAGARAGENAARAAAGPRLAQNDGTDGQARTHYLR